MQSCAPASEAMAAVWPQADCNHLLDDSLSRDHARSGALTAGVIERFSTLARYAADAPQARAAGLLFTCSAFDQALKVVKAELPIPVVAPNEGAFEEALALCQSRSDGGRIGLLVTFAGSREPLSNALLATAAERGQRPPRVICAVVPDALEALQAGDALRHDALVAATAATLPAVDVIILGQFSMARAQAQTQSVRRTPILTTPEAAVRKLRRLVEARAAG